MNLTEGMVVNVLAKMDNEIREMEKTGTVWFFHAGDIAIILCNGDLWKGPKHAVVELMAP